MLWAIGGLLVANWVLGVISGADLGSWIHLMLFLGLIVLALAAVSTATRRPPSSAHGPAGHPLRH